MSQIVGNDVVCASTDGTPNSTLLSQFVYLLIEPGLCLVSNALLHLMSAGHNLLCYNGCIMSMLLDIMRSLPGLLLRGLMYYMIYPYYA